MKSSQDELSELSRAEDIFLGALGFADDATLEKVFIKTTGEIFIEGVFRSDGEKFTVQYDCEIGQLEDWAIEVLTKAGRVAKST